MTTKTIATSEVVFRKDLYPRIEHSQALAQEYAENLEHLPPIEVNQHNELIDGFHRWTAHRLKDKTEIAVVVTKTANDAELLELAIQRNAAHGLQMSQADKKAAAIKIYNGTAIEDKAAKKETLAEILSVDYATVARWLSDIDAANIEQRNKLILSLYLECKTQEEIAEAVGISQKRVSEVLPEILTCEIPVKPDEKPSFLSLEAITLAKFGEPDFQRPIYNVWAFGKKTNDTGHFGNTEQRITDNLLYLYTEPFDIVVDPFGGGGATLDVCRQRLRRCWISDRKPKPGMEDKLRVLDIAKELPRLPWSDVSLTYLDPPYWKQAEGEYSDDADDLANMPLDEFTEKIVSVVRRISEKQKKGAIALIIQPTQWKAPKKQFTDHVFDIVKGVGNKRLTLENRVSCPYSSEQCTPQMVDWAKENKSLLVLSRELIIWKM